MPSIFGHSAIGATAAYVCKTTFPEVKLRSFFAFTLLAANLPDIDIVLHRGALAQSAALAHRNFCHSLLFAAIVASLFGFAFYYQLPSRRKLWLSIYFLFVIISHDVVDAMTKGFGVAFLYPFDKTQYNFPFTPLNPAGWTFREFDANDALSRECLLIWIPMIFICAVTYLRRKTLQASHYQTTGSTNH